MRYIKYLLFIIGITLCSASSFSQSSFAFRAMPSDSQIVNEMACDICIGALLFHRRFEVIEHTVDSFGFGERKFNCLSPNNGINVYQFYVESTDFDSLKNIFNRLCKVSSLAYFKYGCDSIIELKIPDRLTHSNYHFILNKIDDSMQSQWYVLYDESVYNIYSLFVLLGELWDDNESGAFLKIEEWTAYYKWQYINSKDKND